MAVWVLVNNLNCHYCTEAIKQVRGCIKEIPVFQVEGITLNRCPVSIVTNKSLVYIRIHNFIKNNINPFSGGILEQSNKLIEAITFIDNEFNRMTEKYGK